MAGWKTDQNLNTSHVNVNPFEGYELLDAIEDLNTSHVNVNLLFNAFILFSVCI